MTRRAWPSAVGSCLDGGRHGLLGVLLALRAIVLCAVTAVNVLELFDTPF